MNPKNVLRLLTDCFNHPQYDIESFITNDERTFANALEILIKDAIDDALFIESYDTLTYTNENKQPDPVAVQEDFDDDFEEIKAHNQKNSKVAIPLEYKTKAVQYWCSGVKKRLKFESVQCKFKKLRNRQQLYRWEEQVNNGGTRQEKLANISSFVLQQFELATENKVPIHDLDIRRWAIEAKTKFNLSHHLFTASRKWVHNFKIIHRIVSRKINKFVTQANIGNVGEIKQRAQDFVQIVKSEMKNIPDHQIFNSDQSGFNLEMHSGRSLAYKGTAKVESVAQSLNSLTHSYTIQPVVSVSGQLLSPLFIVLKEKDGKFGPIVEKTLYKADNIFVQASSSGKLTSQLAAQWFEEVYVSNVGDSSVLLLDSWSGQSEKNLETIDKGNKKVKLLKIPAGTTGMIQPLDVYGFRPWKNFVRNFSDLVMLNRYDINLHLRNNILKLQSLTHNQFSSPRFVNMFKYAWYKSGYIDELPPKCPTPVIYCFQSCDALCYQCDKTAILKCAWCANSLCIEHFFDPLNASRPHNCETFVED